MYSKLFKKIKMLKQNQYSFPFYKSILLWESFVVHFMFICKTNIVYI